MGVRVVAFALAFAVSCTAGAPPEVTRRPAVPPLDKLLLTESDVGHGYKRTILPDGRDIKTVPTLELCGRAFPSERRRIERVQADFPDDSVPRLAVSHEVVRYNVGGAEEAYEELKVALADCPSPYRQAQNEWRGTAVRTADPRLLANQLIVTQTLSGPPEDVGTALVYQFDRDKMSAVYVFRETVDEALPEALRLAAIARRKLESA